MTLRVRSDRPPGEELARIFEHQTGSALAQLARAPRADAVHGARRACKRARAALRLLRPALGGAAFHRLDGCVRDAARSLAPARDRTVVAATLRVLSGGTGASGVSEMMARLLPMADAAQPDVARARALLERVRGELKRSPSPELTSTQLGAAAARVYRSARRRYARLRGGAADDETFHAFRRQVKYHAFHVRMLRGLWPDLMGAWAERLDELAELLGFEHDLTVSCAALDRVPGNRSRVAGLQRKARSRQAVLRGRALTLAGVLMAERPRALGERLAAYHAAAERSGRDAAG